jgi:hypothetical protein
MAAEYKKEKVSPTEGNSPEIIKLNQPFKPFSELDFANLEVEKVERAVEIEGLGTAIVSYVRSEWTIERIDGGSRALFPFGPVTMVVHAGTDLRMTVISPFSLELTFTPEEGTPSYPKCVVEFPSVEKTYTTTRNGSTEFTQIYSFHPQGEPENFRKEFFVYVPDDPEQLSDLVLTFTPET